jgi:hypothetical protein
VVASFLACSYPMFLAGSRDLAVLLPAFPIGRSVTARRSRWCMRMGLRGSSYTAPACPSEEVNARQQHLRKSGNPGSSTPINAILNLSSEFSIPHFSMINNVHNWRIPEFRRNCTGMRTPLMARSLASDTNFLLFYLTSLFKTVSPNSNPLL